MLTVPRVETNGAGEVEWIGPAPWITCSPPGPQTSWAVSRESQVGLPFSGEPYSLAIRRAQGSVVEDLDGNRYLDFSAGEGVCSVGHCHHRVLQAVQQQLLQLINVGSRDFVHEIKIELSEKLLQLTPGMGLKRVLLGSEAADLVEIAAAIARHHTMRETIVVFDGSSHGQSSLGSFNPEQVKIRRNRRLGGRVVEVPYNDLDALRNLLAEKLSPEQVAAIFVQPILREGSFVCPPRNFLAGLREICDQHHILLVVDENQIGLGSTGWMFCCQYYEVEPDVLMIHRGLGSGFPLGALIAREPILNWPEQLRGLSEQVDSVACAAALATLEVTEKYFIKHHSCPKQHSANRG